MCVYFIVMSMNSKYTLGLDIGHLLPKCATLFVSWYLERNFFGSIKSIMLIYYVDCIHIINLAIPIFIVASAGNL